MDTPQPQIASVLPPQPESAGAAPPPRRLPASEGASWWGESWRIFLAAPWVWIGLLVVLVVVSIALVMVPIVGKVAHTVLTPVFLGGLMLGCHALAQGQPLTIGHLFEGFRGGRFAPLAILGLLWLAALFVLAILMVVTVFLTLGASGLAALATLNADSGVDYAVLASAGAGLAIATIVALVILLLAAMAYWFAPALVVLNGEKPLAALQKSFDASWQNFGAFTLYGLILIGLAIVATIPIGLGWLVLWPMLVGTFYASWRTIFAT